LNYLEAGAGCIATASYQITIPGLMQAGYTRDESIAILKETVHLAYEAVRRFQKEYPNRDTPWIAASIGPYGAYLADGSEYLGNYRLSKMKLKKFHKEKLEIMCSTEADVIALETIPSFREAEVLADLMNQSDKMAWMSFSCKDSKYISDGTPIEQCAELLAEDPNFFAFGVNCTAPRHISGLLQRLRPLMGNKKIIIYPNSGEAYDPTSKAWIPLQEPLNFQKMAHRWRSEGADIIGGCCRIGPEQIRVLSLQS
jgi:homocysteine S-methyltransferase